MDIMAIAAMSIDMNTQKTQQAVDIKMIKNSMDMQEQQAAAFIDMVQQPVSFGHKIDVRV